MTVGYVLSFWSMQTTALKTKETKLEDLSYHLPFKIIYFRMTGFNRCSFRIVLLMTAITFNFELICRLNLKVSHMLLVQLASGVFSAIAMLWMVHFHLKFGISEFQVKNFMWNIPEIGIPTQEVVETSPTPISEQRTAAATCLLVTPVKQKPANLAAYKNSVLLYSH